MKKMLIVAALASCAGTAAAQFSYTNVREFEPNTGGETDVAQILSLLFTGQRDTISNTVSDPNSMAQMNAAIGGGGTDSSARRSVAGIQGLTRIADFNSAGMWNTDQRFQDGVVTVQSQALFFGDTLFNNGRGQGTPFGGRGHSLTQVDSDGNAVTVDFPTNNSTNNTPIGFPALGAPGTFTWQAEQLQGSPVADTASNNDRIVTFEIDLSVWDGVNNKINNLSSFFANDDGSLSRTGTDLYLDIEALILNNEGLDSLFIHFADTGSDQDRQDFVWLSAGSSIAIPLPTPAALAGAGLGAFVMIRRRR
jgi:hypothetical protein